MSERRIQTVADMTSTDIADLLIRYTEQVERIAALENNRDYWRESCMSAQQHRDGANAKLKEFETRAEAAEAKLAAGGGLPGKWRNAYEVIQTAGFGMAGMTQATMSASDCADELEALLKGEET